MRTKKFIINRIIIWLAFLFSIFCFAAAMLILLTDFNDKMVYTILIPAVIFLVIGMIARSIVEKRGKSQYKKQQEIIDMDKAEAFRKAQREQEEIKLRAQREEATRIEAEREYQQLLFEEQRLHSEIEQSFAAEKSDVHKADQSYSQESEQQAKKEPNWG